MRRILAAFLTLALLWGSLHSFFFVTHDVKADFISISAQSLVGGETITADFPKPTSSFVIAYETPDDLEYAFDVRYQDASGAWSAWTLLENDHDMEQTEQDQRKFSQIFFAPLTQKVEVRLPQTSVVQASFNHLQIITFAPEERLQFGFQPLHQAQALQDGLIVTRGEWGADNKYLYAEDWEREHNVLCEDQPWYCGSNPAAVEATRKKSQAVAEAFPEDVKIGETITHAGDKELAWTVQKAAKVNKLFVHHTASLNSDQNKDGVINRADEEIALRGIYYYHSIVRGWGDIGYNYLVGPSGTIYEGRYGGDRVVAAHAVWRNISSAGVSALGNFEEESLGDSQRAALARALAYLSKKYSLDPTGTTFFYGKTTPTILGHRDSDEASTACPGRNIYAQLDSIRKLTKDAMSGISVTPSNPTGSVSNPSFTSTYIPLSSAVAFAAGETKTIELRVLNTGTETWDSSTYIALTNTDTSAFRIVSGDRTAQKAAMIDQVTPPGDVATFALQLQARYQGFSGNIDIIPLAAGTYAMNGFSVPVQMQKGTVSFGEASVSLGGTSHTFAEPIRGNITLKNTGNVLWEKEGDGAAYIEIGASGTDGVIRALPTQGILPNDVAPGASVQVPFEILAPLREGAFTLALTLRIRGDANLFGTPIRAQTMIVHPGEQTKYRLSINAQATPDLVTSIDSSGTYVVYVTNTGQTTWENLSMLEPDLRSSAQVAGLTLTRGVFDDRTLEPGKTTALRFPFQTSYTVSTQPSTLSIDLAGKQFLAGITKSITIQEKKIAGTLSNPTVSAAVSLANIQIRNTGDVTWYPGKVLLTLDSGATIALGGDANIIPGGTASFQVRSEKISQEGTLVSLSFEGRDAPVTIGTIKKMEAPVIPLSFGSALKAFRLQ